MSLPLMLVLRVTQGVFALLVLALSGSVVNWYNNTTPPVHSPSEINFLLFAAIWSFISIACIELLPRYLPRIPKAYIAAPFDATNVLFWFSGFISLAVFLQGLFFCRGAVCHTAQAGVAFGAFSFAVWAASAALTAMEILRARRRGPAGTGAVPVTKEVAA